MVWLSFWQRMRDSNPRKRSQSPVCYRYTNPLCAEQVILYASEEHLSDFIDLTDWDSEMKDNVKKLLAETREKINL